VTELLDNRPWRIGHAAGAVFAGLAAVTVAAILIGPEITDSETFRVLIPVQTLVQLGLIAWWASRGARRRFSLGFRFEGSDLIGLPLGVGFQIAASIAGFQIAASIAMLPIVLWVLDGDAPTQEVVESASGLVGIDIVLVVLGAGLLAPLAEELVFRGVLLRALIVSRGRRFATYVSAAVFAAIHLLDPNAWMVVPILFALGIVLAKVTISTGRIAQAVFTHMAFNLVAVGSLFLVE